jgi:hypothetical protein
MVYEVRNAAGSVVLKSAFYEACVKAMVVGGSVWRCGRMVAEWSPSEALAARFAAMPSEVSLMVEWFAVAA